MSIPRTLRPMDAIPDLLTRLRQEPGALHDYLRVLEQRFSEWEPVIFSFVPEARRWERVRNEAEALLARFPEPAARPPLFGLPVGVKDIFHVDGLPTRAGSRLPAEVLAGPEAAAVTRLKAAGALILGKTITTEFAWFGPGPARNPLNPFHTPGGSSSGSAAAVAAGLVPLALGSQTIGSVNRPAAFCGVVGFKPTYNRISKAGVIELATSHDHVGLFTRDVAGVVEAAAQLWEDWRPAADPDRPFLGIPQGPYLSQVEPTALAHFGEVCDRLQAAGVRIVPVPAMPHFEEIRRAHYLLNAAEAAAYHARFADFHHLYHPKTRELIAEGAGYTADEIETARQVKAQTRTHLTDLLDEHGLAGWITPSAVGTAPEGHASTGNPIMQLPFTNAGLPTLTIPTGSHNGLPLATQLAGRWLGDEALLALGRLVDLLVGAAE